MAVPLTAVDEQAAPVDRPVHVVCCDPNEALCGTNVAGLDAMPDDAEVTCQLCALAYANDLPCANPRCPE